MSSRPALVTVPRSDHTDWKCMVRYPNNQCTYINKMSIDFCAECDQDRSIGAKALDSTGKEIGELVSKDSNGVEYWLYNSPQANGVH
ncbi:hypothetical protein QQZ08_002100 [Neonectria magnoliae]|uniref:RanBP2-type domain-containing protein n=1 Tax=Neonectria magnoliae TaxID=2732573 RepID=A0ABR1IE97_9HYPO